MKTSSGTASRQPLVQSLAVALSVTLMIATMSVSAQSAIPTVTDPDLSVRTVVSGLTQPIGMAFLGHKDFLVTEKPTGRVKRVVNGAVTKTVLDLPVNFGSERGLLSIALHPNFRHNRWVYLFWTESSTGADTDVLAAVGNANSPFPPGTPQPLGNRVDRFVWDWHNQTLRFDRNIVVLRAFQADADQPQRGNHNGGVIRFASSRQDNGDKHGQRDHGHDYGHHQNDADQWRDHHNGRAQLFIIVGDNGRRESAK